MINKEQYRGIRSWLYNVDKTTLSIAFFLIAFGFIMTISSSPSIASRIEVDRLFFIKKQAFFIAIAIPLMITISFANISQIKKIGLIGITLSCFVLLIVLIFGSEAKGSKRWISIAGLSIQPSEFAKTFFVVYNATLLSNVYSFHKGFIKRYLKSFLLISTLFLLIIMQPDLGMSLTFLAIWLVQIFCYGIPLFLFAVFVPIVSGVLLLAYNLFPHVKERIITFLSSGSAKNYQVEKANDAFVNGSLIGNGPGNGIVKNFIPDAHTDFIFAVIGEEFGILSCLVLVLIFCYFIRHIFYKILTEKDNFTYLCLIGLITEFTMQTVVNIGVSLNLLPTKGMTLPFISYGGSSMISMSICFGLILAFTKRNYHQNIDYGNLKLIKN